MLNYHVFVIIFVKNSEHSSRLVSSGHQAVTAALRPPWRHLRTPPGISLQPWLSSRWQALASCSNDLQIGTRWYTCVRTMPRAYCKNSGRERELMGSPRCCRRRLGPWIVSHHAPPPPLTPINKTTNEGCEEQTQGGRVSEGALRLKRLIL